MAPIDALTAVAVPYRRASVTVPERLTQLRAIGVKISLDDFGTGYTSPATLADLPLDEIKLDRQFVYRAREHVADAAIAQTVTADGTGSIPAESLRRQARQAALDEATALLPAVDALAFASTSSKYVLGYDEESALVKRLHERWGCRCPPLPS